jgi:hypothetical protein
MIAKTQGNELFARLSIVNLLVHDKRQTVDSIVCLYFAEPHSTVRSAFLKFRSVFQNETKLSEERKFTKTT